MKKNTVYLPERWLVATTDPHTNSYIFDQCHDAIDIEEVHCSDDIGRPMWWLKYKEQLISLIKARRRGVRLEFTPFYQPYRDEPAVRLTEEDLLEGGQNPTGFAENVLPVVKRPRLKEKAGRRRPMIKKGKQVSVVVRVKVPC